MKKALLAKFRQNPGLLSLLQQTGDKPLIEVSPGDSYWGAGRNGKGQNRLGALLAEVRTELADIRVDEEVLAAAPPVGVEESAGENSDAENAPEDVVADAVAAATGGVVEMAAGGGGQPTVQGGGGPAPGVVMIINPQMGGAFEQARNRRARSRGRDRQISWAGMTVSRDGAADGDGGETFGDGNNGPQMGGAEMMTEDTGKTVEVMVEKLG